jgi:hypothetical protein
VIERDSLSAVYRWRAANCDLIKDVLAIFDERQKKSNKKTEIGQIIKEPNASFVMCLDFQTSSKRQAGSRKVLLCVIQRVIIGVPRKII